MIIIIDECLPKRIRNFFKENENYQVWTVPQIGLQGAKDRDLLDELDKKNIDCFITIDGNIEYQQQFKDRKFLTIVIRSYSNRFQDLVLFKDDIKRALDYIGKYKLIHIPTKKVKNE